MVEGHIVPDSCCLVVEDVITTGTSVLETRKVLQEVGVTVSHVVVLLDREQNGRGNIVREGVMCLSAMTLSQLMGYLVEAGKVSTEVVLSVEAFIKSQRKSDTLPVAQEGNGHASPSPAVFPQKSRVVSEQQACGCDSLPSNKLLLSVASPCMVGRVRHGWSGMAGQAWLVGSGMAGQAWLVGSGMAGRIRHGWSDQIWLVRSDMMVLYLSRDSPSVREVNCAATL